MNCPTPPFSWSSNSHITQEQECAAVQGWVHLKCSWGRHIIPGTFTDNVPSYTECHACHRASKQSKKDKRKQIIMWQKERTLRIYRAILAGLSALPRAPELSCAQAAPRPGRAAQTAGSARLAPAKVWAELTAPSQSCHCPSTQDRLCHPWAPHQPLHLGNLSAMLCKTNV